MKTFEVPTSLIIEAENDEEAWQKAILIMDIVMDKKVELDLFGLVGRGDCDEPWPLDEDEKIE